MRTRNDRFKVTSMYNEKIFHCSCFSNWSNSISHTFIYSSRVGSNQSLICSSSVINNRFVYCLKLIKQRHLPFDQLVRHVNKKMSNNSDEMRLYREAFSLFDKDHDNIIAPQELGKNQKLFIKDRRFLFIGVVLRSCGLSPSEADLQKIQQQVGRKIDFETLVQIIQNFKATNRETEEDIREALRVFDKDGTNYVSVAELKHAMISLGERLTEEEVDELIREADIDADGRLKKRICSHFQIISFLLLRCSCEGLVQILTNKQR